MARYDKYDPKAGGFRAPLAADRAKVVPAPVEGVGLNVNGRVVVGGGNTGVSGVLVTTKAHKAGDIIDVMTDGEIVEFGGVAGTTYFTRSDTGALVAGGAGGAPPAAVAGVTFRRIGHTVEGGRLIVRTGDVV